MFIATVRYVTEAGHQKTLTYSSEQESVINDWLSHKLSQLLRLKCTKVAGSYILA